MVLEKLFDFSLYIMYYNIQIKKIKVQNIMSTTTDLQAVTTDIFLKISDLYSKVDYLEKTISEYTISEKYFSHILYTQLTIFSIMVGALVALYFFFSWRVNNGKIKKLVDEMKNELKKDIQELTSKEKILINSDIDRFKVEIKTIVDTKNKETETKLNELTLQNKLDVTILRGEIYRTLGEYWNSQKNFETSFLWWVRSSEQFNRGGDAKMVRIALGSAKDVVSKVDYGVSLSPSIIGEYQRLMTLISDNFYKIEKDLLESELKNALNRKYEQN